jgi:hypothetical protein
MPMIPLSSATVLRNWARGRASGIERPRDWQRQDILDDDGAFVESWNVDGKRKYGENGQQAVMATTPLA